ncbi:MAG: hypothetical protein Q8L39_01020 [Burkholderiales bacterium]|nr:hypothetical protein [Burkholderiales bacterium]
MKQFREYIGFVALLLGASGVLAAEPPLARQEAYSPIFLLYSGDPTPARLQGLRQFLQSTNASKELIKDTVDTVVYKLKHFKAGFAYPVYASETATTGNTCVVADSHLSEFKEVVSLLTSARIHQSVLARRTPAISVQAVLENVLNHEIFHCYDLMKVSQTEIGLQVIKHGSAYYSHHGEVGADAFAALIHLRSGGDKTLLRQIRDFRTLNLLNGDAAHYTAHTLDHILWNYDQRRLKQMNMRQIVELAHAIREQTALTPDEFDLYQHAAQQFSSELATLENLDDKPDAEWLQKLVYTPPPDPEFLSQVISQVRVALHNLGGDISPSNGYFHPLVKKFYDPTQVRIIKADSTQ